MFLNEYQRTAQYTLTPDMQAVVASRVDYSSPDTVRDIDSMEPDARALLMLGGIGLIGETGEVVDTLKKVIYHNHRLSHTHLVLEVGDCLWYLAAFAGACGIPLTEVAREGFGPITAPNRRDFAAYQTAIARMHFSSVEDGELLRDVQLLQLTEQTPRALGGTSGAKFNEYAGLFSLGLGAQAGILANTVTDSIMLGEALRQERMRHELSQYLIVLTALATLVGVRMDHAAQANIEKLRKRYPDGFDPQRSQARAEVPHG